MQDQPSISSQPVPPSAPIMPGSPVMEPLSSAPATKSHKTAMAVLIGSVVLLGGLATTYAFGFLPVPPYFLPGPSPETVVASLNTLQSAEVSTNIELTMEQRNENTNALSLDELFSAAQNGSVSSSLLLSIVFDAIPSDFVFTGNSISQWHRDAKLGNAWTFAGEYKRPGVQNSVSASLRALGDGRSFYKIDSLPIPFIDVQPVAGKWISVPKNTDLNSLSDFSGPENPVFAPKEESIVEEEESAFSVESALDGVRAAFDAKALVVRSAEPMLYRGQQAYYVQIGLDAEALRALVLERLPEEGAEKVSDGQIDLGLEYAKSIGLGESEEENDTRSFLQSEEGIKLFAALAESVQVDAVVLRRKGELRKIGFTTVVLPPAEATKLVAKQMRLSAVMEMSAVNKEFTVVEPDSWISFREAVRLIAGTTVDEQKAKDQIENVRDLRRALNAYAEAHGGAYPDTLTSLVGTEDGAASYKEVVVTIPNDLYTGQPFAYEKTAESYALSYTVVLDAQDAISIIGAQYVDGKNTATKYALSREILSAKDTDKDELNDYDEAVYGTSKYNKDTDGDGFTDSQEVKTGNDPLKNAKTGKTVPRSSLSTFN